MATTKILPVRKRLKDCLEYAANPKKTEVFRGDALDRLMHYTQNEDKTEHQAEKEEREVNENEQRRRSR